MKLNEYGIPVSQNADGTFDQNDCLQRLGMVLTGVQLGGDVSAVREMQQVFEGDGPGFNLEVKPGVYVRYPGGNTNNVSCDQLISILCYWIASNNISKALLMFFRMVCRFGFSQNYRDGLNDDTSYKIPDFMLIRSLPLFLRVHWILYPLCLVLDVLLVIQALASCGPVWSDGQGFVKRSPEDVDDNNIIMTLSVCRYKMNTPLSWLASKLYGQLRPWNYGCREDNDVYFQASQNDIYSPVYGSLRWYHRLPVGNPEIADLWSSIVMRYFS